MRSPAIRKIWERIKEMVYEIADLIPRRFKREDPEPATGVPTDLDKKLGQKIQQRQEKMGKPVDTSKGGPNMPKYQHCPLCDRGAKRAGKTIGGAKYKCFKHGEFFIRAPKL